jgi:YHS domain-containing protein
MNKLLLLSIEVLMLILTPACRSPQANSPDGTSEVAKNVTDPVCGMGVDPASALKVEHAGKTYYFCSKECKASFEKNPSRYAELQPK